MIDNFIVSVGSITPSQFSCQSLVRYTWTYAWGYTAMLYLSNRIPGTQHACAFQLSVAQFRTHEFCCLYYRRKNANVEVRREGEPLSASFLPPFPRLILSLTALRQSISLVLSIDLIRWSLFLHYAYNNVSWLVINRRYDSNRCYSSYLRFLYLSPRVGSWHRWGTREHNSHCILSVHLVYNIIWIG